MCAASRPRASMYERTTWTVEGSGIGDIGGGWLEHPRQWLGAKRAGLFEEPPGEPPGVPGGGAGAELGHCPDCTLTMPLCPRPLAMCTTIAAVFCESTSPLCARPSKFRPGEGWARG